MRRWTQISPLGESLEEMSTDAFLALAVGAGLIISGVACASEPGTSFQTGGAWKPAVDIRADAAIVYSNSKEMMDSWASRGYTVQTMGGFRLGDDYAKAHPEDVQTTKDGVQLTCGPGSYYLAPSEARVRAMVDYFLQAIRNGSTAVIPEEPEYFAGAGYEKTFKEAWQKEYHEPWQDPASSMDARINAERLKGVMELNMVRSILEAAWRENPEVRRMVAHHSPLNYHSWGISFPFDAFRTLPELQEVIGQVWTGTARSAVMYKGQMRERTFENGLLEYSSLVELYRGSGKRLWFLADPLEDNPSRTMEDYRSNYAHTLTASLMYPEVNAFELLPWPDRIYGRIPDEYATVLGAAFHALEEISRQKASDEPRTRFGVFIGDSAAYQRADPAPGDLTGFYGLALPFVYQGVNVRVAPIERSEEPGYLASFKVLVLSYDFFKPMKPEHNSRVADWVKQGGRLILVGGSNAYNAANQWWRQQGFSSPDEHLLKELGLGVKRSEARDEPIPFQELFRADRRVTDMSNKTEVKIPLEKKPANVLVRFSDAFKSDGWGAMVTQIEVTRAGKTKTIKPGTPDETKILNSEAGSHTNSDGRFADGSASFTYLFRRTSNADSIVITLGNQAVVEWAPVTDEQLGDIRKDARANYETTAYTRSDAAVMPFQRETTAWGAHITSKGFIAAVGKGSVEFLDLPAIAFAHEAGPILLEAVSDAFAANNETLPTGNGFVQRRGPYAAAHALDEPLTLKGRFIDLLSPDLAVELNPTVKPSESRFLREIQGARQPELLAGSYAWKQTRSDAEQLSFTQQGPAGVTTAARIDPAGRKLAKVFAKDEKGRLLRTKASESGGTVFISFKSEDAGPVTVSVLWGKGK